MPASLFRIRDQVSNCFSTLAESPPVLTRYKVNASGTPSKRQRVVAAMRHQSSMSSDCRKVSSNQQVRGPSGAVITNAMSSSALRRMTAAEPLPTGLRQKT